MSPAPRMLTVAMATMGLLACSSWQPVVGPVPEHLATRPEQTIRVTTRDEARVELDTPRASQDSLVGFMPGGLRTRRAIPLDSVAKVEYSRTDTGKTAFAVAVGLGVVGLGILAAVVCADDTAYSPC